MIAAFQDYRCPTRAVKCSSILVEAGRSPRCNSPRVAFVSTGMNCLHINLEVLYVWPYSLPLVLLEKVKSRHNVRPGTKREDIVSENFAGRNIVNRRAVFSQLLIPFDDGRVGTTRGDSSGSHRYFQTLFRCALGAIQLPFFQLLKQPNDDHLIFAGPAEFTTLRRVRCYVDCVPDEPAVADQLFV